MDLMTVQYQLAQSSREVVCRFCEHFSNSDYIKESSYSGKGSIRNLHLHIANTYFFWMGNFALQRKQPYTKTTAVKSIYEMYQIFDQVNQVTSEFLIKFKHCPDLSISGALTDKKHAITSTPFKIFTHVITHGFHHKGQIMSLSKQMGYQPPDTDHPLSFMIYKLF